jgi:hypothetical protein
MKREGLKKSSLMKDKDEQEEASFEILCAAKTCSSTP